MRSGGCSDLVKTTAILDKRRQYPSPLRRVGSESKKKAVDAQSFIVHRPLPRAYLGVLDRCCIPPSPRGSQVRQLVWTAGRQFANGQPS
mmetsp:Transcript_34536/g.104159  ORF Transcript_34536/g.104159 Transcript_34536/m.104159 type:complete len:89 (-) Transcript_34536:79-345(-)